MPQAIFDRDSDRGFAVADSAGTAMLLGSQDVVVGRPDVRPMTLAHETVVLVDDVGLIRMKEMSESVVVGNSLWERDRGRRYFVQRFSHPGEATKLGSTRRRLLRLRNDKSQIVVSILFQRRLDGVHELRCLVRGPKFGGVLVLRALAKLEEIFSLPRRLVRRLLGVEVGTSAS